MTKATRLLPSVKPNPRIHLIRVGETVRLPHFSGTEATVVALLPKGYQLRDCNGDLWNDEGK